MHIIFRLLLLVALFTTLSYSQGARGGSRTGGSGGFRSTSRRVSGSCVGSNCRSTGIIVGSVIGGIFALLAIIFFSVYCYSRYRRRQVQSNAIVSYQSDRGGDSKVRPMNEPAYFKSGNWMSRYHQYGCWHGPHKMSLMSDQYASRVTGHGYDDVGPFTISGTYSVENQQIVLNKSYQPGAGDLKENFGHTVTIQLMGNQNHAQFEDK
ncbi:unnamed protein product [Rotaria sordida]|uniref:Uncharacterized protein n=1 Tax=Rotaria sordida TaxID=392033 RepID=A0A814ZSU2_9BILA|nr:unnamed protein product [Rotaria sordida]CAF1247932.1 unnamed protein product [Rotaria sordida]